MAGRKPVLYEILAARGKGPSRSTEAGRKTAGDEGAPSGEGPIEDGAPPPRSEPRRRTDLVLGVDAAFLLFAVVLVLVATAFVLGWQASRRQLPARVAERVRQESELIRERDSIDTVERLRERRPDAPVLPATAHVLKLISHDKTDRGLARARDSRAYALRQEAVQELNLDAFIFAGDHMYVVAVGPLGGANDAATERVRRAFVSLPGPETLTGRGPRPYEGAATESRDAFGRVVE
jgi:hypothetical protein